MDHLKANRIVNYFEANPKEQPAGSHDQYVVPVLPEPTDVPLSEEKVPQTSRKWPGY